MRLHPFDEVVRNMDRLIARGDDVYLQFLCVHCDAKQTSETPNAIHSGGYSCEECGGLTTLEQLYTSGINFLAVIKVPMK